MKARVKTKVTIHADAKTVFKYLSDTSYHLLWNPHMQTITPKGQLKAGSVYETVSTVLGVRIKAENHVTSYVQDEQLEVQNKTGMVQYSACFKLAQSGKMVTLECRTVASSDSKAFAFARPMMEQLARRELNIDLKALKHAVEQGLAK